MKQIFHHGYALLEFLWNLPIGAFVGVFGMFFWFVFLIPPSLAFLALCTRRGIKTMTALPRRRTNASRRTGQERARAQIGGLSSTTRQPQQKQTRSNRTTSVALYRLCCRSRTSCGGNFALSSLAAGRLYIGILTRLSARYIP